MYILANDSSGKEKPEYMVSYTTPFTTYHTNCNFVKTAHFHNNKDAVLNVHLNSWKAPTQKASMGSDDVTNIN
jgi:hypothetical protein